MKYFRGFIKESISLILEGKITDLQIKNPNVPVKKYAEIDKTKTKKFLPWLVSQHKKGNITPEHPKLQDTLDHFDKTKDKHGILDHTGHDFDEISNKVHKYMGTYKSLRKK